MKNLVKYYPQPPQEKSTQSRSGIDISIRFTKSTDRDAQLRARNEFRFVPSFFNHFYFVVAICVKVVGLDGLTYTFFLICDGVPFKSESQNW